MCTRLSIAVAVAVAVAMAGPAWSGPCPDLISAECGGGSAWFGLRGDGANIGQGQTVTLPCDTAVLGVEFMFQGAGNPNGAVPSMVAGDEIHVVLMDADRNHLATADEAQKGNPNLARTWKPGSPLWSDTLNNDVTATHQLRLASATFGPRYETGLVK